MEQEKMITKTKKVEKRQDYISWDEYFMGLAMLSAKRRKDPSTQVGCCIVNDDKRVVAMGYNGFPAGISDESLSWGREGGFLDTKYAYVVHSEANAILNATTPLQGCKLYVALFPCNECSKLIIQAGIKEVVYLSDKYHNVDAFIAGRKMLEMAGIKLTHYEDPIDEITLNFDIE